MTALTFSSIVLGLSKDYLSNLSTFLTTAQSEPIPQASNPSFQQELDTTDSIYRKVIQKCLTNIEKQLPTIETLSLRLQQASAPDLGSDTLAAKIESLQQQYTEEQEIHLKLMNHLKALTGRIAVLKANNQPPPVAPNWLSQFDA